MSALASAPAPSIWALAATGATPRARRGAKARRLRGPGAPAWGGEGWGFHRDSHGVIAAGAPRFPLRRG